MHTELRVRTLCELTMNEEFYLQPRIVSILDPDGAVISKNALPGSCNASSLHAAKQNVDYDFATSVLHAECLNTTKNGSYSSMWHMYGLASVLKQPIMSVYPEHNIRFRPMLHRQCDPRQISARSNPEAKVMIMWTIITSTSTNKSQWTPNHFVPCFSFHSRMLSSPYHQIIGLTTQTQNSSSTTPSTPNVYTSPDIQSAPTTHDHYHGVANHSQCVSISATSIVTTLVDNVYNTSQIQSIPSISDHGHGLPSQTQYVSACTAAISVPSTSDHCRGMADQTQYVTTRTPVLYTSQMLKSVPSTSDHCCEVASQTQCTCVNTCTPHHGVIGYSHAQSLSTSTTVVHTSPILKSSLTSNQAPSKPECHNVISGDRGTSIHTIFSVGSSSNYSKQPRRRAKSASKQGRRLKFTDYIVPHSNSGCMASDCQNITEPTSGADDTSVHTPCVSTGAPVMHTSKALQSIPSTSDHNLDVAGHSPCVTTSIPLVYTTNQSGTLSSLICNQTPPKLRFYHTYASKPLHTSVDFVGGLTASECGTEDCGTGIMGRMVTVTDHAAAAECLRGNRHAFSARRSTDQSKTSIPAACDCLDYVTSTFPTSVVGSVTEVLTASELPRDSRSSTEYGASMTTENAIPGENLHVETVDARLGTQKSAKENEGVSVCTIFKCGSKNKRRSFNTPSSKNCKQLRSTKPIYQYIKPTERRESLNHLAPLLPAASSVCVPCPVPESLNIVTSCLPEKSSDQLPMNEEEFNTTSQRLTLEALTSTADHDSSNVHESDTTSTASDTSLSVSSYLAEEVHIETDIPTYSSDEMTVENPGSATNPDFASDCTLPFPRFSKRWYTNQGKLS